MGATLTVQGGSLNAAWLRCCVVSLMGTILQCFMFFTAELIGVLEWRETAVSRDRKVEEPCGGATRFFCDRVGNLLLWSLNGPFRSASPHKKVQRNAFLSTEKPACNTRAVSTKLLVRKAESASLI